jgi:endoglycosylceramidase
MDNADRFMMPAIYWTYWSRTPYRTLGNLVTQGNEGAQGLVHRLSLPRVPGNVDEAKLSALVRPYPRAVAGTPVRWSYDPAGRTFELVYTSRPARGFPPLPRYAETEVFVPRRHYPHGYFIAVEGAKVVSRPGAALLRLSNRSRAERVTVRITARP